MSTLNNSVIPIVEVILLAALVAAIFLAIVRMKRKPTSTVEYFLYRFDVFIPLTDIKGGRVDPSKIIAIRSELVDKFGGLTMTTIIGNPVYDGFWKSPTTGKIAQDKNSIFTILVPQIPENVQFFMDKKAKWREFLNYEELLITVHEIQVI